MKSRNDKQNLTGGQTKAQRPRFKIEKLEERIAPAKGGIPGPPEGGGGGGDNCPGHTYGTGRPGCSSSR
jgi:hypothetical protein